MSKLSITAPDGTVLKCYEPTPLQAEFHARPELNVLFYGGRGSGKSYALRWDAHMRALSIPGYKYVILRKTYPELEKTHLIELPGEIRLLGGTYNMSSKKVFYPNGSIGFFSHCQTEADVLNLLGAEVFLMCFDEMSTFEWDWITRLSSSVRAPKHLGIPALVRGATNPYGPSAMKINEYFVEHSVDLEEDPDYCPTDWYAIKANKEDNPYLPDDYSKRLSNLPVHLRKAWIEGEFSYENALFDLHRFKNGKPWHIINDIDLEKVLKNATVYRALDAGWSPDPTVVLWIAHLGNRHIVFNEIVEFKKTAEEISEIIKQEDKRLGVKSCAMTFCDPSIDVNTSADVRTIRDKYEENGIPMDNSINNRQLFADILHNVLQEQADEDTPRLQIFVNGRDGCPYLAKTIPQMSYDAKQTKKMADHKHDHAVVSLCYYLISHSADSRSELSGYGLQLRPWQREKPGSRYVLGSGNVRTFDPYR